MKTPADIQLMKEDFTSDDVEVGVVQIATQDDINVSEEQDIMMEKKVFILCTMKSCFIMQKMEILCSFLRQIGVQRVLR